MKNFVKLCLHLGYLVQNTFHFDEIFHYKIGDTNYNFGKKNNH